MKHPYEIMGWTKVPDETLVAVTSEYQEKVRQGRPVLEGIAGAFGVAALVAAVLTVSAGAAWAMAALGFAVVSAAAQGGLKMTASMALDEAHDKLRSAFRRAQKDVYRERQDSLIRESDRKLAEQGLQIDANTLSMLVAVEPALLKKASDPLAITVHQARQLINYSRAKTPGALRTSMAPAKEPMTFRSERLNSAKDADVRLMRERLEDYRVVLAEDVCAPAYETLTLKRPDWTKSSIKEAFMRMAFAPLFLMRDRNSQIERHGLPVVLVARIPPLKKAGDFKESLEQYEKEKNVTVDLPALKR